MDGALRINQSRAVPYRATRVVTRRADFYHAMIFMAQSLQEQLLEFSKYFDRDCSPSFLELILELLE